MAVVHAQNNQYQRKVTAMESILSRLPFATVAMVARIKGHVTQEMLDDAVVKVQQRHTLLRVRMVTDENGDRWFTSENVQAIPVDCIRRETDTHWITVFEQASQIPFDFDVRPAIRFLLVQGADISELIILCHHVICDGLSLAYLARDVMAHLGDPTRAVEILPDPMPIDRHNIPEDVALNGVVRFFINRFNKKWAKDRVAFDQADYRDLCAAYWSRYRHRMFVVELSEEQTSALVSRCKAEQVSVNTALTAAMVAAQIGVQGQQPYHSDIVVAGSLRDRLRQPVGESMGFYAAGVQLQHRYEIGKDFWENAHQLQAKLKPLYTNKKLFGEPLMWTHLEPAMLEAMNFKKLSKLVRPDAERYQKLSHYSQQRDVAASLLKRNKTDSFDTVMIGTAITNLTRMDFPRHYGSLELDRLIMHPGGAFPLVNVNVVLGAVTCSGKLSLLLEYAEERIDTATAEKIKDKALEVLGIA